MSTSSPGDRKPSGIISTFCGWVRNLNHFLRGGVSEFWAVFILCKFKTEGYFWRKGHRGGFGEKELWQMEGKPMTIGWLGLASPDKGVNYGWRSVDCGSVRSQCVGIKSGKGGKDRTKWLWVDEKRKKWVRQKQPQVWLRLKLQTPRFRLVRSNLQPMVETLQIKKAKRDSKMLPW